MREIRSTAANRLSAFAAIRGVRPAAVLFAWTATFLIGARAAFLSTLAEFWNGERPSLFALRTPLYQARELLIALALCVLVGVVLHTARRGWARRIVLALAGILAAILVVLNLVSAAILPVLGSGLTAGMIVYSDMLFSEHGRIAAASWIPPELLVAALASLVVAVLLTAAILASRVLAGLFVAGSVLLAVVCAVFLVTDADRDSIRKSSAVVTFVQSMSVFDEAAAVGQAPPLDPFAGGAEELAVPLQPGARGRIENVVLVVLESAGAGYFDQYGGRYAITPELTRLAPQSLRGRQVYANTASSFLAMMTMLSARQLEVSPFPAGPRTPMLPHLLREAGLRTAFFHSSDTRAAQADELLASAGFERVRDYRGRPCEAPLIDDHSQFHSQGTLDRCTFEEMERWIGARPDEPFFAMLWTFQSHFDYFPGTAEPLPALEPGEFVDQPRRADNKRRYLAALREADDQVGRLIEFLDAAGLAEETLVVVVGDHGESFDDHGQFGHGGSLYESAVSVPLFLINPQLSPQREFERPTSHIDLAPTIADVLGLPIPREWDGTSLFRPRRASPVIFSTPYVTLQIGYRFGNRKVIAHLLDPRVEVYDLAADPAEQRDLAAGDPELQQRELARIRGWVRYLDARATD